MNTCSYFSDDIHHTITHAELAWSSSTSCPRGLSCRYRRSGDGKYRILTRETIQQLKTSESISYPGESIRKLGPPSPVCPRLEP